MVFLPSTWRNMCPVEVEDLLEDLVQNSQCMSLLALVTAHSLLRKLEILPVC